MTIKNNKKRGGALEDTGERMIPEFHKGNLIYAEHLTRYLAAQDLVRDKVVLDIASGSGYGVKILAEKAKKVFGVDVNKDAIAYSKKKFGGPNIEYRVGDGTTIPLDDNSVDVLTTFETIEHIEDYASFMNEVSRVLKPDGVAIISTPNDIEFPEGAHFHVHEFEYKELLTLVKKTFRNIDPYFQATWRSVAIGDENFFKDKQEKNIRTLNLAPLSDDKYLYFYLICSNRKITEKIKPIAATGQHHSDRELIGSWADVTNELDRRQQHIDELWEIINKTNENNKNLQDELSRIKSSKSYIAASRLGAMKRKAKRV